MLIIFSSILFLVNSVFDFELIFIKQKIPAQNENQFWDLETDEAYSYRYYFWKDNPERFEKANKLKKKMKKRDAFFA